MERRLHAPRLALFLTAFGKSIYLAIQETNVTTPVLIFEPNFKFSSLQQPTLTDFYAIVSFTSHQLETRMLLDMLLTMV